MATHENQPDDARCLFSKVLDKELEDVTLRRSLNDLPLPEVAAVVPSDPGKPPQPAAKDEDTKVLQLRQKAMKMNLVGLALSGGGIRSATFCLGVLQALAECRLLRRFDYLSTVSGGGYIGSWLTAWIKREGEVKNVELQLDPNHVREAEAKRWTTPQGEPNPVIDDEPEPIRHLRAYSNYLAPRPSLFSADGWALIAIYLRNLLLNQLVLLLALLAVLYSAAFLVRICNGTAGLDPQSKPLEWFTLTSFVLGLWLVPVLIAVLSMNASLKQVHATPEECPTKVDSMRKARKHTHRRILWPFLLAAYTGCLVATCPWLADLISFNVVTAILFACVIGFLHSSFNWRWYLKGGRSLLELFRNWSNVAARHARLGEVSEASRWIFSGLGAGAFGGILLYFLVAGLNGFGQHGCTCLSGVVTFGPPLFLMIVVLTGFVHVGIQGKLLDEASREWWSSLGGWVMMYAAVWAGLFGTILYGPFLVFETEATWHRAVPIVGWIISVGGGLFAAHSSGTGSATPRRQPNLPLEILTRLAPAVFLIGMLILVAATAFAVRVGHWPESGHQYLEMLNKVSSDPNDPEANVPFLFGPLWDALLLAVWFLLLAIAAGWFVDVNVFSLQGLYSNRLVRCYLGASRRKPRGDTDRPPGAAPNSIGPERDPNVLTGFDPRDDFPLHILHMGQPEVPTPDGLPKDINDERQYQGPLLLVNTTLNLVQGEELAWQERKGESFVLTPRYCGSKSTDYRQTEKYAGGLSLGKACGVSGAAVSPNMGFHSAPAVTALLTVFNARLGAWLGNPHEETWHKSGPGSGLLYLLYEMMGRTNAHMDYVYLSDGGHFDNLGVYELIRRRCRFIVVCDAGCDPDFALDDLGGLIRKARIDFGVRIDMEIEASGLKPVANGLATSHFAFGKIRYGDVDGQATTPPYPDPWALGDDEGLLIYIKPALTGDEPSDVANYATTHAHFPHDSTANQFFAESEFESYRALGYHSAIHVFRDVDATKSTSKLFSDLLTAKYPPPAGYTANVAASDNDYIAIQRALRDRPELRGLSAEIYDDPQGAPQGYSDADKIAERHMVAEMLAAVEVAWFQLRLKETIHHPVYECWLEFITRWFRSPRVREHWKELKAEFNRELQEWIDELIQEIDRECAAKDTTSDDDKADAQPH